MFRRAKPPTPQWKPRVDDVRAKVREHAEATTASVGEIDRVEVALEQAQRDLDGLDAAIAGHDLDGATAELKAALRARVDPMAGDTPLIGSLRRRRESIIALHNRRNELAARIEATVVDLDAFAARLAELSFVSGGPPADIGGLVARLNDDADALIAAHDRLSEI